MDNSLTSGEIFLIRWLAAGLGQLGECEGPTLNTVMTLGYAEMDPEIPGYVTVTPKGMDFAKANGGVYDGTN